MSLLSRLFGDGTDKHVQKYQAIATKINELEETFESFSLEQLKEKTQEFKDRLEKGETHDNILPEAFAAVREASKRTLGQRHYDVQLIGGMVLHSGSVAEMRTGEGKTLTATTAVYLNALEGKGVHVITVNDYLSQRDAAWMGQIYDALGLTTACINHDVSYIYDGNKQTEALDHERDEKGGFEVVHEFLRPISRKEAYQADITYGTNNEFGFDYLRDNMARNMDQLVQVKGHNFAIVDEVDSILIDESRTPLIISAPDEDSGEMYKTFSRIVPSFKVDVDYTIDEKLRTVSITEDGINKVEQALKIDNIYEQGGARYVHHLEQALKAQVLYQKDKHYVVKDGEVVIVDEFTGRMMPGRRWSGGLHQAVEAKEGVLVQKESRTYATITFQNYFRLYNKLSGMTGTGKTSQEEFHKVYNLDVVVVPTNRPMVRQDDADRIYKTETGKTKAIVAEVKARHEQGQPVLIGTPSIEKNEVISAHLKREGLDHQVLNAKNHEQEGQIIAQAGRTGAITVATNMAGRGVDVILGGNPASDSEAQKVRDAGGLHVIGTERHEARRIDNQLRGRAGRQGDPGSSQFFVSTEDEVVRVFAGDRLTNVMQTLGVGDDDVIENRMISNQIERAQERIEGHHFDSRKRVLEYDDVMNRHRSAIYNMRREILETDDNRDRVVDYVHETISTISSSHVSPETNEIDTKEILETVVGIIPLSAEDKTALGNQLTDKAKEGSEAVTEALNEVADKAYVAKELKVGPEDMRRLEKMILLQVIDQLWVDHLEQMEQLRDSVRLRAYGQRDPLVEYKVESQRLFNELQEVIGQQVTNLIYKMVFVNQQHQHQPKTQASHASPLEQKATGGNAPQAAAAPKNEEGDKIGRNDPCYCGSGKKYKKCGLINAPEHKG